MRKQTWLRQEIAKWQTEGLIAAEQAERILARYDRQGGQLARLLFSVIGAVVFGLGVILFFAWNWSSMGHVSKLAVIFTALLTAHVAGAYYRQRGELALGEGLSALGTLLFGSGIFLVSQIYHIDDHFPNALLVWGSGALLLAWALPSTVQGLLACLIYAVWVSFEAFEFHRTMHWAAPLLALVLLPLAWQQRSRWLFRVALLTILYILLVALLRHPDRYFLAECMLIAFTLIAVSPLLARSRFPDVADMPREFGYAGYVVLLVLLAFRDSGQSVYWLYRQGEVQPLYLYLLGGLAVLALAGALRYGRNVQPLRRYNFLLVLISTLLVLLVSFTNVTTGPYLWIWANLAALAHAVLWIIDGARQQHSRKVTVACVLFAAIAIPRFLDLFDSLLMRSLMFLALGAGLFLVGNFYQRQKPNPTPAAEVAS